MVSRDGVGPYASFRCSVCPGVKIDQNQIKGHIEGKRHDVDQHRGGGPTRGVVPCAMRSIKADPNATGVVTPIGTSPSARCGWGGTGGKAIDTRVTRDTRGTGDKLLTIEAPSSGRGRDATPPRKTDDKKDDDRKTDDKKDDDRKKDERKDDDRKKDDRKDDDRKDRR
eukprot:gene43095-45570_t